MKYLFFYKFIEIREPVKKKCGKFGGGPDAGFIGIPRKIMALKNLKAIIIDLNYIKGILFFLDLTGE